MIIDMRKYIKHSLLVAVLVLTLYPASIYLTGCAASYESRYMLDDPVNDPIMTCDDQQDSDLVKVEEGGGGSAAGGCPT